MTTYNTGNPLPSTDVRDRYDNAENLDYLVNGPAPQYEDRLGVPRKSWSGMEDDFQVVLDASLLIPLGNYAAGIQFTSRNQYLVRSGVAYRPALSTALPYTTTGTWVGSDESKFSVVDFDQPENSIKRYGATGTGGDDLAAINNAISDIDIGNLYASQNTRFLVSAPPTNPNGVDFIGGGVIASPESTGVWQRNTQFDKDPCIGREYLYRAWAFIQTQDGDRATVPSGGPSSNLNVFLYGDSTAVGFVATTGPTPVPNLPSAFYPDRAIKKQLNNNGVRYAAVTQRAVSGTSWRDLNLIPDLASVNSLFFIKYGINDAVFTNQGAGVIDPTAPVSQRIAAMAAEMDAKLTAIRAAPFGGIFNAAIVLVGPTSTCDTENGRNEEWYEQVRNVYQHMARKHLCCYVDAYAFLRDSRNGAQMWMDQPYGTEVDGRKRTVHMRESAMAPLWAWIVDQTFPKEALAEWGATGFSNVGTAAGGAGALAATGPLGYRAGITWERATVANGFPKDGFLKTERFADGHARQTIYPAALISADNGSITRGITSSLLTWHARWTGVAENLALQSSWVDFATATPVPGASLDDQGYVQVQGSIKSGTITAGTTTAALPAGMRPAATLYFLVSTNAGTGTVSVDSTGAIKIVSGGDATRMSLDNIRFKAA